MKILLSLVFTALIVFALQLGFEHQTPGWAVLAVYLLGYALLAQREKRRNRHRQAAEPEPDHSHWPTSGPYGRYGRIVLPLPWTISSLLVVLNPWQLLQLVRQITWNLRLGARAAQRGSDGSEYLSEIAYSLPFAGEWLVCNGGMTPKTSHSWGVLGQRFALDFFIADADVKRHTGRGTRAEEYFCYGQDILAAADGVVEQVEDRIGQAPLLGWGVIDFSARSFVGNHVLIRHAECEFALYAHLIRASVEVQPGDTVRRGQRIGRCGHTGHSSEPHLHFHLQDSANLFGGMGLPIRFGEIIVDGQLQTDVLLSAGRRVRNPDGGTARTAVAADYQA